MTNQPESLERLPLRVYVLFYTPLDIELKRRPSKGHVTGYRIEPDGSETCIIHGEASGGTHNIPFLPELVAPVRNKGRSRRHAIKEDTDE